MEIVLIERFEPDLVGGFSGIYIADFRLTINKFAGVRPGEFWCNVDKRSGSAQLPGKRIFRLPATSCRIVPGSV
jgi:hypothetical protein